MKHSQLALAVHFLVELDLDLADPIFTPVPLQLQVGLSRQRLRREQKTPNGCSEIERDAA